MKSATPAKPNLRLIDGARKPAPRPDITITSELFENVVDTLDALRADPDLFQRDAKLVHVINVSREEAEKSPIVTVDGTKRRALVEGSPTIREMQLPTLREHLARFVKYSVVDRKGKKHRALPSGAITSAVHTRGEWGAAIRKLDGITEVPVVRPDGSILQSAGYDSASRYLYLPRETFPSIPERPTRSQVRAALTELVDVFTDFPFVDQAHAVVPVAALLTLLARPFIAGSVPAFLFDAASRGSGKSLLTDVIALIFSGRVMPRMNYPADDSELEKVLGGYAIQGDLFFSLDNVTRRFGGGPLDRILTSRGTVQLRVLGQTYVPTLMWLAVVFATGNNLMLCGDTVRRVLLARLESPHENPENRDDLVHADLLGFVQDNRVSLIVAALTVVRGYIAAGSPNMGCASWGSFEEWSRLIPHALLWAGAPDVMGARPGRDADVDTDATVLAILLGPKGLSCLDPDGKGLATKDILAILYPLDKQGRARPSADHAELCEAIDMMTDARPGKPPDTTTLGTKLRGFKGRVIAGKKLAGVSARGGSNRWRVVDA